MWLLCFAADPEYSDDSDVDDSDIPWDDYLDHQTNHTIDYSDGPYSNMLRDFTLRSYVTGGGRKQNSFSDGTILDLQSCSLYM